MNQPDAVHETPYTVNGFYLENCQAYTGWVTAATPEMAVLLAQQEVKNEGGTLEVCGVFEGHLTDVAHCAFIDPNCKNEAEMAQVRKEWGGLGL